MQNNYYGSTPKKNRLMRRIPCLFVLSGGLGNQLFTYAAGLYFSEQNNRKVIFELSDIDLLKNYHTSTIVRLNPRRTILRFRLRRLVFTTISLLHILIHPVFRIQVVYGSPLLGYDSQMETKRQALLVRGHFQTYRYLSNSKVAREITQLKIVEPTTRFSVENAALYGRRILGVHVRLGNYSDLQESFGSLSGDYFRAAILTALSFENSKIDHIYLYSEEIDKALDLLDWAELGVPLRTFGRDSGLTDEETLALMSKSDSLVISNSTFSWWAGALGNQEKKVYAPTKWFKGMEDPIDLYPSHWKLIDSKWT